MNALTTTGGGDDLTAMIKVAEMLCKSKMVPKDYVNRPEDVLVAVIRGRALGLDPVASMESIAMVNGRACLYGDAFLAIVQSHPHYGGHSETPFEEIERTGVAVCTFYREGREYVGTFSVDDAKRARLWGKQGPWSQYPSRMLQMRARGFAGRDAFADALKGLITREEAQDLPSTEPKKSHADLIAASTASPGRKGDFNPETDYYPPKAQAQARPKAKPKAKPYESTVVDVAPEALKPPAEEKKPPKRAARRPTPPNKGLATAQ